jgi:hypothetical protein
VRSRREVVEVRRTLAVLQRASRFPLVFGGAVAGDELRISTLLGNTTSKGADLGKGSRWEWRDRRM